MSAAWRLAYGYAKASGALAKGFLGEGARDLAQARDPRSLTKLIYPGPVPESTESALIRDAEAGLARRMRSRAERVLFIAGRSPGKILRAAFLPSEAERAKSFLKAALLGGPAPDASSSDPEAVGMDEAAFPDVRRMFERSIFTWAAEATAETWTHVEENRMDREARLAAWDIIRSIRGKDGLSLRRFYVRETSLRNAVWALRLAFSFSMRPEEIVPLLVDLPGADAVAEALAGASFQPDARAAFQKWKLSALVDDEAGGDFWRIDPASSEARAEKIVRRALKSLFRASGPSEAALYAYLRRAEAECDVIRSAYESLRIGPEPQSPARAPGGAS